MGVKFDNRTNRRLHLKKPAGGMVTGGRVEIVDMSLTGLGIIHDFPLRAGAETFLEFAWAGKMLQLWVRVTNCRPKPGGGYRTGLQLIKKGTDSDNEYLRRVKEGLERLKATESDLPPSV